MEKINLFLICLFLSLGMKAQILNGFDLSNTSVPNNKIFRGGPPRDGIPSIDKPVFENIRDYREFDGKSEILGVYYHGIAKAYPVPIMDWHEVVNDYFDDQPVVITYCPLCGSGIGFVSTIDGEPTEFGVSGLLYNSDVLLYDRNSLSLWSQILAEAISGPQKGKSLEIIPTQRTTLSAWKKSHPESLVLTTNTGYQRSYQISPYGDYDKENRTYFPLTHEDDTFHKKEWVIGLEVNGTYKAYPISQLVKHKGNQLTDEVGGTAISLTWDAGGRSVNVRSADGEIPALQMFWFAWVAFHPDTLVFEK